MSFFFNNFVLLSTKPETKLREKYLLQHNNNSTTAVEQSEYIKRFFCRQPIYTNHRTIKNVHDL